MTSNSGASCEIIVKARDKAICCNLCNKWTDIKCNNLNNLDYEDLKIKNNAGTVKSISRKFYHFVVMK